MVLGLENSHRTAVSPNIVANIKSLAQFARKRKGCFCSSKWVSEYLPVFARQVNTICALTRLQDCCGIPVLQQRSLSSEHIRSQRMPFRLQIELCLLRWKKGPGFAKEGIEARNGSTGKSWNLSALFQVCSFTPLTIIFKSLRIDWPNWMPQYAV